MALSPRTFDHSRCTPRAICPGCGRPARVCYCAQIERIETTTHVLILQHPRERKVGINTARIARLCLPNAQLCRAVDFSGDPLVCRALSDPHRRAILLYPGPGSIDIRRDPPKGPVTLVVLDGTWWQASKLLKSNPAIAALPRYAFTPSQPSRYRIRSEPDEHYVATIEAMATVLGVLEGDEPRMARLLVPFEAMVEHQLAIERDNPTPRRHPKPPKPRAAVIPKELLQAPERVVIAAGEANAWPRGSHGPPAELVHWVAVRLATGDRFEAVVRPRGPLSPGCDYHVKIERDRILAGESFEDFSRRWAAFFRAGDRLCTWGRYAADIAAREGLTVGERLDVRAVALRTLGWHAGASADCAKRLAAQVPSPWCAGRAGLRIAELEGMIRVLLAANG